MKRDQDPNQETNCQKGGGTLFGEPQSKPKNSYSCPEHGTIPSSEVDWQGIVPHCPNCDRKLETSVIKRAQSKYLGG